MLIYVHPATIASAANYLGFLRLRLARIYPLHVFVLCCLGVVVVLLPNFAERYPLQQQRFSVEAFVASLLLIQNWAYFVPGSWNAPSWSLSAEWFAYLAFPLFQVATQRPRSTWLPIVAIAAGFVILGGVLHLRGLAFDLAGSWGMVRMIVEFGAGCLLYRTWANGLCWRPSLASIAALVLLLMALFIPRAEAFALPAFSIAILLAAQRSGWVAAVLSSRAILWLGEISYTKRPND